MNVSQLYDEHMFHSQSRIEQSMEHLNNMFNKLKIKYNFNDKLKNKILKEFCDHIIIKNNNKNLLKYVELKSENLIINYLSHFIMKKICLSIHTVHEKTNLCVPFMKIMEFIFFKTDKTFILYNLSNDQSLSFIASIMSNITKVIQYVTNDFEINNKITTKKTTFVTLPVGALITDAELKLNVNSISVVDCSIVSSKYMSKLTNINSMIVVSFGKKIFQDDAWNTYRINQYNIGVFVQFNKKFF